MNEQIRIFKKFDDGTTYLMAFLIAFSWLLIGSTLFMIPMIVIGANKEGLSLVDYAQSSDLILVHSFVAQLVSQIIAIGIFGYFFFSICKKDFHNFKKHWIYYSIIIIVGFLLLVGLNYFSDWIYTLLGLGEETSTNQKTIIDALNSNIKILVIIGTVICASIFEEIVFRKFLYGFFKHKTKLPAWVIVIIISIIFAGMHVISDFDSLAFFPAYFGLAFIITGAYALTRENIFVAIGMHFLNNLLSVVLVFI